MKNILKQSLIIILVAVVMLTATPLGGFPDLDWVNLFSFEAEAMLYSNTCGDNLTWILNTETGILEINGTGDMTNWSSYSSVPWYSYRSYIKSVNIGDGVTTIGEYAFYDFNKLKTVTIGSGVEKIFDFAFYSCDGLVKFEVAVDNKYYSNDKCGVLYNRNKTVLVQYPAGNTGTSYIIPNSVIIIDDYAFYSCDRLMSITIPNLVMNIGDYAFYGCIDLMSLTIDGVTTIGDYAFYSCDSLIDITIPDTVTVIGEYAFCDSERLKCVTVNSSKIAMSMGAFAYCDSLEYVHISADVTNIGEYVLLGSTGYICSTIEDCYVKTYADENGIEFRICAGHDMDEPSVEEPTTEEPTTEEPTTEEPTTEEPTTEEPTTEELTTEEPTTAEPTTEEPTTEHKHTPKTVTVPASCTVNGMEYTVCAECGEPIGGVTIIPAGHTYGDWETVTEATCKAEGKRIKKCTVCDEILQTETIDKKAHTPGEWETVIEPTVATDGKRIKKCTVCGEILEEEAIAKLKVSTAVDEKTGVEMEYLADDYEGEVEITVEEAFDGTAFDIIDTTLNSTQKFIYDITMTVNGVATQPNGKVTVKIPLPSGYDPTRTFVYHVNSNTGKLEPMYAEYKDGYLVFETTHFSYYALVEVLDVELKINKTSKTKINFGDTLVLRLAEIEIPEGYAVKWFVEGAGVSTWVSEDGLECRVTSIANGNPTIYAKLVDKEENVVTNADGEEIFGEITLISKAGFWQKFISFFKNLFRINRVIY